MPRQPGPRSGPVTTGPATPARGAVVIDGGRRRFVLGLAATGLAAGLRLPPVTAAPVLAGPEVDLTIGTAPVRLTGARRQALVINGSLPAPTLRFREGDTVTLRVHNTLAEPTAIHWHGLLVPADQDGVPGLSFPGIAPGATFTYRFPLRQSGTYWYHSHAGLQEQLGLYGAIVIDPADPAAVARAERVAPDHDHVVVLSDWTDEDPAQVLAKLKKQADYYNFGQRTLGTLVRDLRRDGWSATLADRGMWGRMRMNATDLADVSGYTYTYLVNGAPPAANWTALYRPGEPLRLRFINASAMTFFDVRIPGLAMTVVAADGQPVEPVTVDEFRLGTAETLDVIVTPGPDPAYPLFAQAMDRSGYARGTLAPRAGLVAPVPPLEPRAPLTMADMGHGDHAGHGGDGTDHAAMGHAPAGDGADHAAMGHAPAGDGVDHAAMGHAPAGDGTDHAAMGHAPAAAPAGLSPTVDMRATDPQRRLADPGVGLRGNGRRVLTYADLRSRFADPDGREPGRTITLHLTGHMDRYRWSFDGVPASRAAPIHLSRGERVRIVLVNDSMMAHPVHLHGLWSDLEDEQGRFLVRKHTLVVKPGELLSYRVTADAPGRWAYHCHLLLHMELGMFREVVVDA
jgi:CopA family copper-resistance protein